MSRILALGSNSSGQLGLSHLNDVSHPTPVHLLHQSFEDDYPISIVAGGNHTLILYKSGAIFAAGSNAYCCCGFRADVERSETFERVIFDDGKGTLIDRFKFVAATWEASFFVTRDDVLYVAGRGMKGELGLGEGLSETVIAPKAMARFSPEGTSIEKIASCMGHVVVLLSSGELWGWGTSRKGQLGPSLEAAAVVPEPVRMRDYSNLEVMDVACGRDFTVLGAKVNHGLEIVLAGKSKWLSDWKPGVLSDTSTSLTACWSSVYLLTSESKVLGFGRGDRGQLPPADLPPLAQVASGSEHCLGLTRDGRVLAWGWGEHGNCGLEVNEHGITTDSFSRMVLDLEPGWSVSMVGAGCATSFIVIRKPPDLAA